MHYIFITVWGLIQNRKHVFEHFLLFAFFQVVNVPAASDFGLGHLSLSMSGIGKAVSMAVRSVSVL